MIGKLNQENTNMYTILKNIQQNLYDVEQVLQLKDKMNKKLEGNHQVVKLYINLALNC